MPVIKHVGYLAFKAPDGYEYSAYIATSLDEEQAMLDKLAELAEKAWLNSTLNKAIAQALQLGYNLAKAEVS